MIFRLRSKQLGTLALTAGFVRRDSPSLDRGVIAFEDGCPKVSDVCKDRNHVVRVFEMPQGRVQRLLVPRQESMSDLRSCGKEDRQEVTPRSRNSRLLLLTVFLSACSGTAQPPATQSHCSSSSDGPSVGPIAADAGTDPGCQPGGRCLLVQAPELGPPCNAVSTDGSGRTLDAGSNCVSDQDAGPSWSCVYETGSSSNGSAGAAP